MKARLFTIACPSAQQSPERPLVQPEHCGPRAANTHHEARGWHSDFEASRKILISANKLAEGSFYTMFIVYAHHF